MYLFLHMVPAIQQKSPLGLNVWNLSILLMHGGEYPFSEPQSTDVAWFTRFIAYPYA